MSANTPAEVVSAIPRDEYIASVLNHRAKPVEARADFSKKFLGEKAVNAEGFKRLVTGAGLTLAPDFDFNNAASLTRVVLDLQHKLGFPQVDNAEGQDGIFGIKTFEATQKILEAEKVAASRLNALRTQVSGQPEERLVLGEGIQPGLAEALQGVEGQRWVGKLPGNGNREVALFIPKGTDPTKPFEVIYHFHGVNGHLIGQDPESTGRNRIEQVLQAAQRMGREGRNVVVVYPLSAGHRAGRDGKLPGLTYDSDWMRSGNRSGDDMNQLHAGVLSTIESQFGYRLNVGSITAKGHSAGGTPLVNIAEGGFKLDRIDFLDASYRGRIPRCYTAAIKNNPQVQLNIFLGIQASRPQDKTDNPYTRSVEGKRGVTIIRSRVRHGRMNETYFDWKRP